MRHLLTTLLLLLAVPALAASERVVRYLDGAWIERLVPVRQGVAILQLPPDLLPGSLRVEPLPGAVLNTVDVTAPPLPKDAQREKGVLAARRDELEDRLAALAVKEEVFRAAAKAQSGKSPKRTKTNPDPLSTIRQGTEYAVAQLEAVYRSRRSAERELAAVKRKLSALAGDPAAVGSMVRVAVRSGRQVKISYLTRQGGWAPRYQLHLEEKGRVRLELRGSGGEATVVPATLATAVSSREFAMRGDGMVAMFDCSLANEQPLAGIQPALQATLTCTPPVPLPAGDAACLLRGSYLGTVPLPVLTSGVPVTIECGKVSGDSSLLPSAQK